MYLSAGLGSAGLTAWFYASPEPVDRLRTARSPLPLVSGLQQVALSLEAWLWVGMRVIPSFKPRKESGVRTGCIKQGWGRGVGLATVCLAAFSESGGSRDLACECRREASSRPATHSQVTGRIEDRVP